MDRILGCPDIVNELTESLRANSPTQTVALHRSAATCLNGTYLFMLSKMTSEGPFETQADVTSAFLEAP